MNVECVSVVNFVMVIWCFDLVVVLGSGVGVLCGCGNVVG